MQLYSWAEPLSRVGLAQSEAVAVGEPMCAGNRCSHGPSVHAPAVGQMHPPLDLPIWAGLRDWEPPTVGGSARWTMVGWMNAETIVCSGGLRCDARVFNCGGGVTDTLDDDEGWNCDHGGTYGQPVGERRGAEVKVDSGPRMEKALEAQHCGGGPGLAVHPRLLLADPPLSFPSPSRRSSCSHWQVPLEAAARGLLVGVPRGPIADIQCDPARPVRVVERGAAWMSSGRRAEPVPTCGGTAIPPNPWCRRRCCTRGTARVLPCHRIRRSSLVPSPALHEQHLGQAAAQLSEKCVLCDLGPLITVRPGDDGCGRDVDAGHGGDDRRRCVGRGERGTRSTCTVPRLVHLRPFWAEAARIGEAANPGPLFGSGDRPRLADVTCSILPGQLAEVELHKSADRPGFRYAKLPGMLDPPRADGAPHPDNFSLTVATLNSTSWNSAKHFIETTDAHVIALQELHLMGVDLLQAIDWARRRGWYMMVEPALPGQGSGSTGGVAILARTYLGMSVPVEGGHRLYAGRAIAARIQVPSCRPFVFYSLYLKDGAGLGQQNADIMGRLVTHARMQPEGTLVLAAGDFQVEPEQLATLDVLQAARLSIVAAEDPRGTCRSTRSASCIDYFVMSAGLAKAIKCVDTVTGAATRPHVPVRLQMHPRITALKALRLRKPPDIPQERLFGPLPPPPAWDTVLQLAQRAQECAEAAPRGEALEVLGQLYYEWAQLAEKELAGVTGVEPRKWGCRGCHPRLVWQSIVPERVKETPTSKSAAWRTLGSLAADVTRLAAAVAAHAAPYDHGQVHGDDPAASGDATRDQLWALHRDLSAFDVVALGTCEGGGLADDLKACVDLLIGLCDAISAPGGSGIQGQAADRLAHCATVHDTAMERIRVETDKAMAEDRADAEKKWRKWIGDNFDSGAKNAHAFVRGPQGLEPSAVVDEAGVVHSDPFQLLEYQRSKHAKLWKVANDKTLLNWPSREALPLADVARIRAAAATFDTSTACAYDGFRMRHYTLLSDPALSVVASMFRCMELLGALPPQLDLVTIPMLPKPKGGFRAIGIFPSLYRLWARTRKPEADAWEEAHRRPYYSAAAGRSAQDTVWRQAIRAEAGVNQGLEAASVLWDMAAFYEGIERERLLARAWALGFPPAIIKLALAAYSVPRMLTLGGILSQCLHSTVGVVAGCGFANVLVKVYTLTEFDFMLTRLPPTVTFDSFVDDLGLSAVAAPGDLVEDLSEAADLLADVIENGLASRIAEQKSAVVSSSAEVARALEKRLGEGMARVYAAPPNLGIDYGAAKRRRAQGRDVRRVISLRKVEARKKRLRQINRVVGNKALRIYTTGCEPSPAWNAPVNGVDDAEVLRLRRLAASTLTPKARGRSLNMLLLLYKAPTFRIETAPIHQLSKEVWRAACSLNKKGDLALPELAEAWRQLKPAELTRQPSGSQGIARRIWGACRGPLSAAWLTAHRLGWSWDEPFVMTDDLGVPLSLIRNSPAAVLAKLRLAACRQLERAIGRVWARTRPEFAGKRVAVDHIRSALTSGRALTPVHRGAARAMVCNAIWTNSRAAQAGFDVENKCPACGLEGDTPFHRTWKCCASEEQRCKAAPAWLRAEAARADPSDPFWVTGVFVHPAHEWPSPLQQQPATIVKEVAGAEFDGDLYIDGSCTASPFIELRRAGASVVACDDKGAERARAIMPIPADLLQTPQAAEYGAFALVLHLLVGQPRVYGDCAAVVLDSERKPAAVFRRAGANAGIVRAAMVNLASWRALGAVTKVKAHQTIANLPDGREKVLAIGNGLADEAAKQAAALHPRPAPAQESMLQAKLDRAAIIIKTVAHTLEVFPRLRAATLGPWPAGVRDGAPGARATRARSKNLHDWQFSAQRWRCVKCLAMSSRRWLPRRLREQPCRGFNASMDVRHIAARGHRVVVTAGNPPLVVCMACGSWSVRRARGLAGQCPGVPTHNGKAALARIAAGEAPWIANEGGARMRLEAPAYAWNRDLDAWVPRGGWEDEAAVCEVDQDAALDIMGTAAATAVHQGCEGAAGTTDADACMHDSGTFDATVSHPMGAEVAVARDALAPTLDELMDVPPADCQGEEDPFGHGGALDQCCEEACPAKRPRSRDDGRSLLEEEPHTRRRTGDPANDALRWRRDVDGATACDVADAVHHPAQGSRGRRGQGAPRHDALSHGQGSSEARPRRARSARGPSQHQGPKRPRLRSHGSSRAGYEVGGVTGGSTASSSHVGETSHVIDDAARSLGRVSRNVGGGRRERSSCSCPSSP